MSTESLPQRKPGQKIDSDWFNIFRRVLTDSVVGRNLSGIASTAFSSLGRSTQKWIAAHVMEMKFGNENSFSGGITASSGMATDYTLKLPQGLPVSGNGLTLIDSVGQMSLITPDGTIDTTTGPDLSLADRGFPKTLLDPLGQQIASNSSFTSASASFTAITNASVSLTVTGRPVFIGFIINNPGDSSTIGGGNNVLRFKRGATEIARLPMIGLSRCPNSIFRHIDIPAAGTYTYTAEVASLDGTTSFQTNSTRLIAYEYW